MFKVMSLVVILILSTTFLGFNIFNSYYPPKHSYIGTKTCGMCHKKEDVGQQLKIWESSKHSQAYKNLKTEKADKVAKDKGFKTKAVETKECLKCHVSGYDVDASLLNKNFKVEDGVQCETCHGPGSEYKSKNVMQDKKLAVEKGLMLYKNPEELFKKCHNDKSPFFKGFEFKTMWAKIVHTNPKV